MNRMKRAVVAYLAAAGLAANVFLLWIGAGGPIFIDRWLDVTGAPRPAELIICPTAGLAGNNLPGEGGWQVLYTAVQLYFDGLGKKIIFTGGGTGKITEAEVYAEAAGWLGCPEEGRGFEPGAVSTAEHPEKLLQDPGLGISRETALNIVSSRIHSRRLALCFKKAGFRNFNLVSSYVARKAEPALIRENRVSRFADHQPSGKSYDDFLNRLRWQSGRLFESLREVAAIVIYKLRGLV